MKVRRLRVRRLRMMNAGGDKTIFEWNPETVSEERLKEIEAEFKQKMKEGWFAADITDKRNVLIDRKSVV